MKIKCLNDCNSTIHYFSTVNQYYCKGCGAIWSKEGLQNDRK